MKRSQINAALREMEAMCAKYRFALPPFCHFNRFNPPVYRLLCSEYPPAE